MQLAGQTDDRRLPHVAGTLRGSAGGSPGFDRTTVGAPPLKRYVALLSAATSTAQALPPAGHDSTRLPWTSKAPGWRMIWPAASP